MSYDHKLKESRSLALLGELKKTADSERIVCACDVILSSELYSTLKCALACGDALQIVLRNEVHYELTLFS